MTQLYWYCGSCQAHAPLTPADTALYVLGNYEDCNSCSGGVVRVVTLRQSTTTLNEVRRYWPWMGPAHVDTEGHFDYQCVRRGVRYLLHICDGQWWVSIRDEYTRRRSAVFVDEDGYRLGGGDTVAAAMAAAGFGERKKGPCAERNRQESYWSLPGGYDPFVKLEGRQRPRKGVRLGRRKRKAERLQFEAWLDKQLDKREWK